MHTKLWNVKFNACSEEDNNNEDGVCNNLFFNLVFSSFDGVKTAELFNLPVLNLLYW